MHTFFFLLCQSNAPEAKEELTFRGASASFHEVGCNDETAGYVTTPNTKRLLAEHKKAVGGKVGKAFGPACETLAACLNHHFFPGVRFVELFLVWTRLFCMRCSPPGGKAEDDLAAGLLSIAHRTGHLLTRNAPLGDDATPAEGLLCTWWSFSLSCFFRFPLSFSAWCAAYSTLLWNVNEDTMTHRSKGNRFGALQEPNNSFSLV